jgi:hypothetical protein
MTGKNEEQDVADAYRTSHRLNLINMFPQDKIVFDLENGGGGSSLKLLDKIPLLADDDELKKYYWKKLYDESDLTKTEIVEFENELAIQMLTL